MSAAIGYEHDQANRMTTLDVKTQENGDDDTDIDSTDGTRQGQAQPGAIWDPRFDMDDDRWTCIAFLKPEAEILSVEDIESCPMTNDVHLIAIPYTAEALAGNVDHQRKKHVNKCTSRKVKGAVNR